MQRRITSQRPRPTTSLTESDAIRLLRENPKIRSISIVRNPREPPQSTLAYWQQSRPLTTVQDSVRVTDLLKDIEYRITPCGSDYLVEFEQRDEKVVAILRAEADIGRIASEIADQLVTIRPSN